MWMHGDPRKAAATHVSSICIQHVQIQGQWDLDLWSWERFDKNLWSDEDFHIKEVRCYEQILEHGLQILVLFKNWIFLVHKPQ